MTRRFWRWSASGSGLISVRSMVQIHPGPFGRRLPARPYTILRGDFLARTVDSTPFSPPLRLRTPAPRFAKR